MEVHSASHLTQVAITAEETLKRLNIGTIMSEQGFQRLHIEIIELAMTIEVEEQAVDTQA